MRENGALPLENHADVSNECRFARELSTIIDAFHCFADLKISPLSSGIICSSLETTICPKNIAALGADESDSDISSAKRQEVANLITSKKSLRLFPAV